MEELGSFGDFSAEIGDYEMKKAKKFDRLWKITEGGSIDQRPLVVNGRVYIGCLNHNVYCIDALNGQLVWKFRTRDRIGISSPAESDGIIYIGSYDYNMYALDAETGDLIWKFHTEKEIISTACVKDGKVFFCSGDQNLYCLDAKTGEQIWKFRTSQPIICEPVTAGDSVIFGSYDENYYCVDINTGTQIWKTRVKEEIVNMGGFAILDNAIFVNSFDGCVYKIDVSTGRIHWKKKFSQYGFNCGTVPHDGHILQATREGNLYMINVNGDVVWKFSTNNNEPVGTPIVFNNKIFFTSEDMNYYCVSLDGELIWKTAAQQMNWWGTAGYHGTVYFGSYDCNLYALDDKSGEIVWKFRTAGSPSYIPPLHDEYELTVTHAEPSVTETSRKEYNIGLEDEKEETLDFYKSRITYQLSTQYSKKGKYQVDSQEEAF